MAIKIYKPTTPGQRVKTGIIFKDILTATKPHKSLTKGFKRDVGRSYGQISMRHKGGGHKRLFRDIDFSYDKKNVPAKIETIEYDPNRSAYVGLALYADGERRYVVLPEAVKVGSTFIVGENAPLEVGNRLSLKNIPVGAFIYNIEIKPNGGAKLVRSAGSFAQVLGQTEKYTMIKMPSTEVRNIPKESYASIGKVSNEEHRLVVFGKAGRSRHKGIRPTVRGSAMNPVDHPYGGGEGRQPRGTRRPKTMWGKTTGGHKTRNKKKYSQRFIVSRRKVGKKEA